MLIYSYWDGFDDASQKLRYDSLPQIKAFGLDTIVAVTDFSVPLDEQFAPQAKANGLKVILEPNTGDWGKLKTYTEKNDNIIGWNMVDDADLQGFDAAKKRYDALSPYVPANQMKIISCSKGVDGPILTLAPHVHIQLYTYGESNLKKWWWERLLDIRSKTTSKLYCGPALDRSTPAPAFGVQQNNAFWMRDEYTAFAYNQAAIYMALCAGFNGVGYYTLFYGVAEQYGKDRTRYEHILERVDFVQAYQDLHKTLKRYEQYFDTGKREAFDRGRIVGAKFTLPTGEWIEIQVDTHDFNPSVRITDSKDIPVVTPPPAPVASVKVDNSSVTISGSGINFKANS